MKRPDPRSLLLFRLRIMLLYPAAVALVAYYRFIAPLFGRRHQAWLRVAVPRLLSRLVLRLHGVRVAVEGGQHLQAAGTGPRVLLANHNSRLDAYALLAVCPFAFKSFWSNTAHVTTERFGGISLVGRTFDLAFLHDKFDIRRTVREFRRAQQYLTGGGVLSFFPEGRFSEDGRVREIGDACVAMAVRTGAPIVPIVLLDTRPTFEDRGRGRPPVVRMLVQPPIATAGLGTRDIQGLVARIEQLMNDAIAAHHAAAARSTGERNHA